MGDIMIKQDCAIKILNYMQCNMNYEVKEAIKYCEGLVDENGLSIYDLCAGLQLCGIKAAAYHTLSIPECCFIAFIGAKRRGHFMLVQRFNSKIWYYDPIYGEGRMSILHFFLIWRKTLILLDVN